MTGAEAAGELVTGGLIAGAVEGRSGERHCTAEHAGLCLNCGTGLLGSYCHRCGQPEHIHRSLGALWHDIAHSVLHFEGKIWNTLPLLAWRPGELTRRFIHGERARFVSPMALFLFSVFLMFATFSAIGASFEVPDNKPPSQAAQDAAKAALPEAEAKLAQARARQKAAATEQERLRLEKAADDLEEEVDSLKRLASPNNFTFIGIESTGWKRLDEGIAKANKNPNLAIYKMQSSAYKFSWALIPLSVPFLWLLYAWHRQYRLYDHAVFVTYSLGFMSMLVIVLTLLGKAGVGENTIAVAAMTIPPLHMYRQLRGAYGTRRRWAILRTVLLVSFAAATLFVFFLLLLALGVLG
jgi:hypothetical protein